MIEQLFSNFGFRGLWTPELIVGLMIVAFFYFRLIGKWRTRFVGSEPVKARQKVLFVLGLFALYLGWGSPLYVAGHMMMTFHMLQMVFAYYIAVPLLMMGIPKWFYRDIVHRLKNKKAVGPVGKILFKPILALFIFNGLFSIYHIPLIYDFLMQTYFLHDLYYFLMLGGAFLMWWHMLAPLPSKDTLPELRRILYIFLNGVLITPACASIIFSSSALYGVYTDPVIWAKTMAYCLPPGADVPYQLFGGGVNQFSPLTPKGDQQLAGILMKILQEFSFSILIGYVFRQWVKKEKQSDGPSISDIPETMVIKN